MPDPFPHDAAQHSEELDELAQEFAQQLRQGRQPSIEDYARRYPQWAAELHEMLPSVVALEQMRRRKLGAKSGSTSHVAVAERRLRRLGDYRIVREIGRGGMGVVYEAEQESLGRHVAVKVLPHNALVDSTKLDRFTREAQAAAALHHTNIVPVFGVGEADGLHYYVMQLIDGQGLDRLIARLRTGKDAGDTRGPHDPTQVMPSTLSKLDAAADDSSPRPDKAAQSDVATVDAAGEGLFGTAHFSPPYWRAVAAIGQQIAAALQYAHEQGILHRDIKPANLLVDKHQAVWITDFGLAKFARQSDLTATGQIVGTLQYMAPECLKGQADARSDVYSLGLALYELATLRQPVANSDAAQMFRQISQSSPIAPRQVNPLVPRDLETIILTATAHEPRHRYASAGELAADLTRFLEDRPILARRAAHVERVWRWCRRNPVTASWTATTVGALILAGVVGWVGYANTTAALQRESEKKTEADKATERADKNVELSLAAFEEIFNKLAPRDDGPPLGINLPARPPVPREESEQVEADAALLQSVLGFYERFAAQNTTNPKLQLEAAKAHRHIGDIQNHLEKLAQSQAAYGRSVELLRKLTVEFPAENVYRTELAQSCLLLEPASASAADRQQLIDELTAIYNSLDPAASGGASSVWQHERRAKLESKLGWELHQAGQCDAAEKMYRRAIDDWNAVGREKQHPRPGIELSTTQHALAKLLSASGAEASQLTEARKLVERSIEELYPGPPPGRADDRPPPPHQVGQLVAGQYTTLSEILKAQGDQSAAATAERKAEELLRSARGPAPRRLGAGPGPGPGLGPGPGSGPRGGPGGGPPGQFDRPRRGEGDFPQEMDEVDRPPRGPADRPPRDGRPPPPRRPPGGEGRP